jgi:hypothetical protein
MNTTRTLTMRPAAQIDAALIYCLEKGVDLSKPIPLLDLRKLSKKKP